MRHLLRWSAASLLLLLTANFAGAQIYLNYSVNQPAVLTANAGGDHLICIGEPANLGGAPTAAGGYGGYGYTWVGIDLNNAAIANPIATPAVSATYVLTVADSLGCTAFDTVDVVVDTCVGLQNLHGLNAFDVFPNPNEGRFTVEVRLAQATAALELTVVDLAGKELYRKSYLEPGLLVREQLSLVGLARGTYFVRMQADGQLVSRKMIIR